MMQNMERPSWSGQQDNGPSGIGRARSPASRRRSVHSAGSADMAPAGPAPARMTAANEAAKILDDLCQALDSDLHAACRAAARLVEILAAARDEAAPYARGGLAAWQKRQIEQFMQAHLDQPLPLTLLAGQASLSVSHFCRAFKESFGRTVHAHLMQLRVEQAKQMMRTTREPLSQIALACGLSDQAHLSKRFRLATGETPTAWRRRNFAAATPQPGPRLLTNLGGSATWPAAPPLPGMSRSSE